MKKNTYEMYKFVKKVSLIFIIGLISIPAHSQQIDSSVLEELSDDQINSIKSQLSRIDNEAISNNSLEAYNGLENESITETIVPGLKDSNKIAGEKYGYDFFSSIPSSVTAMGDLPLPNDYKISLRDQLTVILSGSRESIFDLTVKLDGTILFPELGSISVIGETFGEVKKKLKNLIDQSYNGVNIDLSIKNLSAKKVTIVGAVKTPGTYIVNPFSTISSALSYSGGISEIGTLREIKLIRSNGEVFFFDLYQLLVDGKRSQDIKIEAGDVIVVDAARQFVEISGSVNRPAIYEMKKGESLQDLLRYSLGFNNLANKTNISISMLDPSSSSIKKITTGDLNESLENVLEVNIFSYTNKEDSQIYVEGAVREPGYYSYNEYSSLEDLISSIEFIDVYPWVGILEQFDPSELRKSTILFSLNDPNTFKSVKLLPNARVFFADIDDRFSLRTNFKIQPEDNSLNLLSEYKLRINHKNSTYELPVIGKYRLMSFVNLLGLDISDVDEEVTYISPFENKVVVDNFENMTFEAQKFHTVSFKSKVYDLINVVVDGAVEYPGTYTLKPNTTLNDLYSLVGEFKDHAFEEAIIFSRQSIRNQQLKAIERSRKEVENILIGQSDDTNTLEIAEINAAFDTIETENLGRIAGDFSRNSESSKNLILVDGDSVTIPQKLNIISVVGEVLNPISFEFDEKTSLTDAVLRAGGLRDYADKSQIYVIRANGMIERPNRNIFMGTIRVEEGDTVVVPRKFIVENQTLKSIIPVTQILSDLAFSAAAIDNLRNN